MKKNIMSLVVFCLFMSLSLRAQGAAPVDLELLKNAVTQITVDLSSNQDAGEYYTFRVPVIDRQYDASFDYIVADEYYAYVSAADEQGRALFQGSVPAFVVEAFIENDLFVEMNVVGTILMSFTVNGMPEDVDVGEYPQIYITTPDGNRYYGGRYRNEGGEYTYYVYLPIGFEGGVLHLVGNGNHIATDVNFNFGATLEGEVEVEYSPPASTGTVNVELQFPGDCLGELMTPEFVGSYNAPNDEVKYVDEIFYVRKNNIVKGWLFSRNWQTAFTKYEVTLPTPDADFVVNNGYLYTIYYGSLVVIDVNSGETVGRELIDRELYNSSTLGYWNGYIYATNGYDLYAINVADPTFPVLNKLLTFNSSVDRDRCLFHEGYFYGSGAYGTVVYELDGASTKYVSSFGSWYDHMVADGQYLVGIEAYPRGYNTVYDISDPAHPVSLGQLPWQSVEDGAMYPTENVISTALKCGIYIRSMNLNEGGVEIFDLSTMERVYVDYHSFGSNLILVGNYLVSVYGESLLNIVQIAR